MEKQAVKPLVLISQTGEVLGLYKMNEKGYRKSLENKVLWILHEETHRLLPLEGEPSFKDLREKADFYSAVLTETSETKTKVEAADFETPDVLDRLWQVIQKRNQDRPEGSYTTHLFEKGVEKIKKKLGEEAVEVILAGTKEETIYESADLIYHLFVLLTASGVDLEQVYLELAKRAK